jgi:hypothetical protein
MANDLIARSEAVVTISKLSFYDSSLLSQKFTAFTLIQIAISAQKTEIMQKILHHLMLANPVILNIKKFVGKRTSYRKGLENLIINEGEITYLCY